ncbi:MAG: porin family protein [Alphaproteobacteria bacterium]|nr:porin family protein [Alphaproteobacteria bacterium]
MLKNTTVATLSLLCGLFIANNAAAGCNGLYIGVRGGLAKPTIDDQASSTNDYDIGGKDLMLSGALGYRHNYFRAEAEYIWHDTNEKEIKPVYDPDFDIYVGGAKSEFDYSSYMFNVYFDLAPYTWFTPYVNAGVGITHMEYNFTYADGSSSYEENNFTWSVGGGLSAKMTNKLNLDVGYRYFDYGKIKDAQIHSHEVYGGLRYVL